MNENENLMPELAADVKNVAAPTLTLEQEAAPTPTLTLEPAKAENQLVVDNANNPIGVDENILSEAEKTQMLYCSMVQALRRKWLIFQKKPSTMLKQRIWER